MEASTGAGQPVGIYELRRDIAAEAAGRCAGSPTDGGDAGVHAPARRLLVLAALRHGDPACAGRPGGVARHGSARADRPRRPATVRSSTSRPAPTLGSSRCSVSTWRCVRTTPERNPGGRVTLLATGRQGWGSLCRLRLRRPRLAAAEAAGPAAQRAPGGRRRRPRGHPGADRGARGRPCRAARPVQRRRPGGRRAAASTWPGTHLDRWRHLRRATPSSRSLTTWITSPRSAPRGSPSSPATPGHRRAHQRGPLPGPGRQPDRPGARRRAAPGPARLAAGWPAQRPRLPRRPGRHDRHGRARREGDDRSGHGASAATLLLGETGGARHAVHRSTRPATSASAPITCRRSGQRTTTSTRNCATAASTRSCTAVPHGAARPAARAASAGSGPHTTPATASSTSSTSSRGPAWPATSSRWPTWRTGSGTPASAARSGAQAPGSFVNHLLGISAIDPLEHDLLMERFLVPGQEHAPRHRPGRGVGPPPRRVPDHLRPLRGGRTACVCHDGDLPGAQRDQGRRRRDVAAARRDRRDREVLPAHPRQAHHTRRSPSCPNSAEVKARTQAQLATHLQASPQQLDGLPRHVAMHPCGVLLSDRSLLDRTAVQASVEGFPLSQLDKDDAEIAGRSSSTCSASERQLRDGPHAHRDRRTDRTRRSTSTRSRRDDKATYAMIQRSETIGCFQIESTRPARAGEEAGAARRSPT